MTVTIKTIREGNMLFKKMRQPKKWIFRTGTYTQKLKSHCRQCHTTIETGDEVVKMYANKRTERCSALFCTDLECQGAYLRGDVAKLAQYPTILAINRRATGKIRRPFYIFYKELINFLTIFFRNYLESPALFIIFTIPTFASTSTISPSCKT